MYALNWNEGVGRTSTRYHRAGRILLALAAVVSAAGLSLSSSHGDAPRRDMFEDSRIIEPEALRRLALSADTWIPVIVNLAVPDGIRAFPASMDSRAIAIRRQEIQVLESTVLSRLPGAEFAVRHRMLNQGTVSGKITRHGLDLLLREPGVQSVEIDHEVHINTAQGIPLMNATAVRTQFDGAGLSIAIVDTGIDYTHPALGNAAFPNTKVIGGHDFGDDDNDPADQHGHGTSVAGVAAGDIVTTGDYVGGVAPGATLYALKIVAGSSGSANDSDIIAAWDWCVTHRNDDSARPIRVINTSFSGGQYAGACDGTLPAYATAANNAVAAGITIFASAGNDGYCAAVGSPACLSNVIAVGAVYDANIGSKGWCIASTSCIGAPSASCTTGRSCTDNSTGADQVTCYSNSASIVGILAPSNDASVPQRGGGYTTTFGGTSAASPYASGAAALLLHAAQASSALMTPADVRTVLRNTGDSRTDAKSGIATPRVNLGNAVAVLGTWVDFAYVGVELGTPTQPFNTLAEGVAAVPVGGRVIIRSGTSHETPTISKALTLVSTGGAVVVGP